MSENNLINKIISAGKRNNIDQGELAQRAGIRPETISRAKKNPNIHLDTLKDLARIVGLRITLVPDHPVAQQIQDGTLFPR